MAQSSIRMPVTKFLKDSYKIFHTFINEKTAAELGAMLKVSKNKNTKPANTLFPWVSGPDFDDGLGHSF